MTEKYTVEIKLLFIRCLFGNLYREEYFQMDFERISS